MLNYVQYEDICMLWVAKDVNGTVAACAYKDSYIKDRWPRYREW
jgi:hypothetical protein